MPVYSSGFHAHDDARGRGHVDDVHDGRDHDDDDDGRGRVDVHHDDARGVIRSCSTLYCDISLLSYSCYILNLLQRYGKRIATRLQSIFKAPKCYEVSTTGDRVPHTRDNRIWSQNEQAHIASSGEMVSPRLKEATKDMVTTRQYNNCNVLLSGCRHA